MRMIELILTELASDKIKAEEKLQRLINNNGIDVDDQVEEIKLTLAEVVKIDQMINKWKAYTTPNTDNNNNNN